MSVSCEIIKNTADAEIAKLVAALDPATIGQAVGPAVAKVMQSHLRGLGTNKKDWPSTHFWGRAARATNWALHPDGALVSINQIGVRQRYHGGHISPVKAKALAIPISPVSYGHLPSEFPGLFLLKTKKGAYLVQAGAEIGMTPKTKQETYRRRGREAGGNSGPRQKSALNFLFKLSSGVDQEANPDVLPTKAEMMEAAKDALKAALWRTSKGALKGAINN
jgi:hypothetical protein